ncbi:MAG: FtsW/RodA/SpoVE family cell cycle protein [Hespellia sp.]|nr:FtsW/RodA/SpoVE family cell cycle protein [Hespellia sp.]
MGEQEYLELLESQLRCKKAREMVMEEVKAHIEDQREEFLKEGMSTQEALEEAVREMGDPVETGVMLDRIHRPQMEWKFLTLILGISLLSMVMQGILGGRILQVAFSLVGILVMFGVCFLDYSVLGKYANAYTVGFILLSFILIFFLSTEINGGKMSVEIGPFTLSLWSFMHLYPPIYGAFLYSLRNGGYGNLVRSVLGILPVIFLILYMPSISLACNMLFLLLIMLSIAIGRGWMKVSKKGSLVVLWGAVTALPAVLLFVMYKAGRLAPYQVERIKRFFSLQFGDAVNVNMGGASYDFQNSTQYVITYLMQYYGTLAGAVIVALLVYVIFRIFRISLQQKNQLGMMVGIGCGLALGMQVWFYTLQNLGIVKGYTVFLPLFSSGGSGTLVAYILLGLVLSIHRYQNVMPSVPKWKKRGIPGGACEK